MSDLEERLISSLPSPFLIHIHDQRVDYTPLSDIFSDEEPFPKAANFVLKQPKLLAKLPILSLKMGSFLDAAYWLSSKACL